MRQKMSPPEKNLNVVFLLCRFNLKYLKIIEEIILHICPKFHMKTLITLKVIQVLVLRTMISVNLGYWSIRISTFFAIHFVPLKRAVV